MENILPFVSDLKCVESMLITGRGNMRRVGLWLYSKAYEYCALKYVRDEMFSRTSSLSKHGMVSLTRSRFRESSYSHCATVTEISNISDTLLVKSLATCQLF